jgi:DNA gyrase/topoisomerase IV subunit A
MSSVQLAQIRFPLYFASVNLLYPSGQFGTRRMGGKDHASARYIFTRLEKIARAIFHPDDDPLLNYLNDDGLSIEPEYYMPVSEDEHAVIILPMIYL